MKISAILLTKNVESHIKDCLESIKWVDEIVLIDGGSTDKTLEIAKKYGARIIAQKGKSYDEWRNQGKEEAKGAWILYIDPDERVTPLLRKEIEAVINAGPAAAFAIPRRNFVFGKELRHGGWYPDYVVRLFKKERLIRWVGELHEQPEVEDEIGYLKDPLIHLKEDNLSDMVSKTNKWSEIEARLLYQSGHPKMSWWRFFRVMITEIFDRLILKLGFLDGVEGIIFSIYQGWSKFVTYAKLWEMQQKNK